MAKLLGGEVVIDVDSAENKPVRNMLLAINEASTYEGVVNAIRKFAPYDAMVPQTVAIPGSVVNGMGNRTQAKEVAVVPIVPKIVDVDTYDYLYKGG